MSQDPGDQLNAASSFDEEHEKPYAEYGGTCARRLACSLSQHLQFMAGAPATLDHVDAAFFCRCACGTRF